MANYEIKIEMSPSELSDLRIFLTKKAIKELEVQEIHQVSPGFHSEPLVVALVVALGGPVVVKEFCSLLKEWLRLRHEENMMKLSILYANETRPVATILDLEETLKGD